MRSSICQYRGGDRSPGFHTFKYVELSTLSVTFLSRSPFSWHFLLLPTTEQSLFSCPECQTNFDTLQDWREHMEKIHQSETLYKCEQCGKAFGWKKFLRQHIRQEHVGKEIDMASWIWVLLDLILFWISVGDGSGFVFSMRNGFRAGKTTLQEECDRQERLIGKFMTDLLDNSARPDT